MRVAIMQPYFLPYIGYFQLMQAVETFVIYDDVNYIKQGWIARNRILCNGKEQYFILPVHGASSFKHIKDIGVAHNPSKMLRTIQQAYGKAPYFGGTFRMLEHVLTNPEKNLAGFLTQQLRAIVSHLGLKTRLLVSSDIGKPEGLAGQDKVLFLCKTLGATMYINAIGGRELYSAASFETQGIELRFIQSEEVSYQQFGKAFVPWLSILDVLMFNSIGCTQKLLGRYTLV